MVPHYSLASLGALPLQSSQKAVGGTRGPKQPIEQQVGLWGDFFCMPSRPFALAATARSTAYPASLALCGSQNPGVFESHPHGQGGCRRPLRYGRVMFNPGGGVNAVRLVIVMGSFRRL